jgi:hypothetical protein
MRLFFAVSPTKQHIRLLKETNAENMLISYHFIKSPRRLLELMEGYEPKNLIIDSGAFSVWSNGGSVDINDYAKFCKDVKEILSPNINLYCVNLDVLPGKFGERPNKEERENSATKGWENMLYLESLGLKVIHVFHQHEDFSWLIKLSEHSDYIGVSPANDCSMREKELWMNKVYSIIKDKVKTHGFAVTSHTQLYKYPLFSCDSSSWTAPGRFGRIPIFTDDLKLKSFVYKCKEDVLKFWDYIKDIGIDVIAADDYRARLIISIKSYQKLQKIATDLWTKRGVIWKE